VETPGSEDVSPYRIDAKQVEGNFATYAQVLTEFTKRTFTNSYDALNEVTGIFNRLQALYGGYPFVFGLPTSAFDAALLWEPKYTCRRRRDPQGKAIFPSWTWAGWEGEIEYGRIANHSKTLKLKLTWARNDFISGTSDNLQVREQS